MKTSQIISIIAIAAVLIFFILMFAAPDAPGWLVFIAAGLAMVIAQAVNGKGKNGGE